MRCNIVKNYLEIIVDYCCEIIIVRLLLKHYYCDIVIERYFKIIIVRCDVV